MKVFVICLLFVVFPSQAYAKADSRLQTAVQKLVTKVEKKAEITAKTAFVSPVEFYGFEDNVSTPMAVGLAEHLKRAFTQAGYAVEKPPIGKLNGWLIKGYWSPVEEQMSFSLQAEGWANGKRKKTIMVSFSVAKGDVAQWMDASQDIDVWGRTLIHRLQEQMPQNTVHGVYVRPFGGDIVDEDPTMAMKVNQWFTGFVEASITMHPVYMHEALHEVPSLALIERATVKDWPPKSSLGAKLSGARIELVGDVAVEDEKLVITAHLQDDTGYKTKPAKVDFPMALMNEDDRQGFRGLREAMRKQAARNKPVSYNGLEIELVSDQGEMKIERAPEDPVRFFVRGNKPVHLYGFHFFVAGRRSDWRPVMPLDGRWGQEFEKGKPAVFFVEPLPDEFRNPRFGRVREMVWVVAIEGDVGVPEDPERMPPTPAEIIKRFRKVGENHSKGYADTRIVVQSLNNGHDRPETDSFFGDMPQDPNNPHNPPPHERFDPDRPLDDQQFDRDNMRRRPLRRLRDNVRRNFRRNPRDDRQGNW